MGGSNISGVVAGSQSYGPGTITAPANATPQTPSAVSQPIEIYAVPQPAPQEEKQKMALPAFAPSNWEVPVDVMSKPMGGGTVPVIDPSSGQPPTDQYSGPGTLSGKATPTPYSTPINQNQPTSGYPVNAPQTVTPSGTANAPSNTGKAGSTPVQNDTPVVSGRGATLVSGGELPVPAGTSMITPAILVVAGVAIVALIIVMRT
jgi:hypothetical protein